VATGIPPVGVPTLHAGVEFISGGTPGPPAASPAMISISRRDGPARQNHRRADCFESVEIRRHVFIPRVLEHASNLAREDTFRRQILRDLVFTKKSNLAGLETGFWDPRDNLA